MHELSIVAAIVQQVEEVLDKSVHNRVLSITLSIGDLSGVEPTALEQAFPLVAEGTRLDGAQLIIERVEPEVKCRSCGNKSLADFPLPVCAKCNGKDLEITGGREMIIKAIEVESSAFSNN